MPTQAFYTINVQNKCVIINAENFKDNKALWNNIFPFGC